MTAKLPALEHVTTGNAQLDRQLAAIRERLEVREGARGDPLEAVITRRDLKAFGLSNERTTQLVPGTDGRSLVLKNADGSYSALSMEAFAQSIRDTSLFKDLLSPIGDLSRFDQYGPVIDKLEAKSSAGEAMVSTLRAAYASADKAISAFVTTVRARLDSSYINPNDILGVSDAIGGTTYANLAALQAAKPVGVVGKYYKVGTPVVLYRWDRATSTYLIGGNGTTATVEQSLIATVDRLKGSEASFTVKVSAGGAVGGFGLSATDNGTGSATSALIVQADKFAIVTSAYAGSVITPTTANVPFGVDASGVFINGTLRINTGGTTLGALGPGGIAISVYQQAVSAPATPTTGTGSFNFTTNAVTAPAGWSTSPPATSTTPTWISQTTVTGIGTVAGGTWTTPVSFAANGTNASTLSLDATGVAFLFLDPLATSSAGPTITLTAVLQNITGTASFVATAYNAAGASLGTITLGGSGNARTLSAVLFNSLGAATTRYVIIVATLGSLTDTTTVYRGDGGSDAMTALLTNEAHTVPTDSAGSVLSLSGASTVIKVFRGIVDDTINWAFSKADSGMTTSLTGSGTATVIVTATAMSASIGTATITATRTGYATLDKVFTVTKSVAGTTGTNGAAGANGTNGARGSVTRYASGSSWVDATALAAVGGTAVIGDTVTISNATFAATKYWGGAAWVDPGVIIDGNLLVNGTISAAKISATTLSAISADLGTVTAGTITGATIQTAASGARVVLTTAGAATGLTAYTAGGATSAKVNTGNTIASIEGYGAGSLAAISASQTGVGLPALLANSSTGVAGSFGSTSAPAVIANTTSGAHAGYFERTGISPPTSTRSVTLAMSNYAIDTFGQINVVVPFGEAPFRVGSNFRVAHLNVATAGLAEVATVADDIRNGSNNYRFTGINTVSGGGTSTFSGALPAGSATSTNQWLEVKIDSTSFWVPIWVK